MDQIARHLEPVVFDAIDHFRVVVVHGARQSGKTTLVRSVVAACGGSYVTLDDEVTLRAALADPFSFLDSYPTPLAIDEIQLGGDRLVRTIKQAVDGDPRPGRFLLTGSTNFLTVPTISESLAGRARILRLWPLSQAEIAGTSAATLARWFDDTPPPKPTDTPDRDDYFEHMCRGGYPEVVRLPANARLGWFESYIETVTQRDIAALADIRKISALPRLLQWVAATTATEPNITKASESLGIGRQTITTYLDWLQNVFLIHTIAPWSRNVLGRAVGKPKLHITDTGLLCDLLDADPQALRPATSTATGPVVETFVVNEIARSLTTSPSPISLGHYRDRRREIDLILQHRNGRIIAIEIKATRSPSPAQLDNMYWLRDKLDRSAPGTFHAGILLHTGDQSLTVDDRLYVRPISSLW